MDTDNSAVMARGKRRDLEEGGKGGEMGTYVSTIKNN